MSAFAWIREPTRAADAASSRTTPCSFPLTHVTSGGAAALVCWAAFEPFFREGGSHGLVGVANVFMFPAILGAVSAVLCAAVTSSAPRFGRFSAATVGWAVTFAAAFLALIPIQVFFDRFLNPVGAGTALREGALLSVMAGRSIAWGIPAATLGLGLCAGTRSPSLMTAASVGGLVGGLIAGLLFDPLQMVCGAPTGVRSWLSRLVGFMTIAGMSSLCVGIAHDRPAWGHSWAAHDRDD